MRIFQEKAARMTLRILHVLDHSIPMQSGYTFRTRAILREQRRMGWETFHLTSPKHTAPGAAEEDVDGLRFLPDAATPAPLDRIPGVRRVRADARDGAAHGRGRANVRPDILHAHSPVLNALPALRVGRRLGIPVVYEVRAFWEDAAVDHGTSREGGLRYRLIARARDIRAAPRRPCHDDLRGIARGHRRARYSRRARSPSSRTRSTSRHSSSAGSPTQR